MLIMLYVETGLVRDYIQVYSVEVQIIASSLRMCLHVCLSARLFISKPT